MPGKRGGKRPGAGRKKGSKNQKTRVFNARIKAADALPLDYMLRVMRDSKANKDRRDKMAIAAAPYIHPRLQAVEHITPPPDQPTLGGSQDYLVLARQVAVVLYMADKKQVKNITPQVTHG